MDAHNDTPGSLPDKSDVPKGHKDVANEPDAAARPTAEQIRNLLKLAGVSSNLENLVEAYKETAGVLNYNDPDYRKQPVAPITPAAVMPTLPVRSKLDMLNDQGKDGDETEEEEEVRAIPIVNSEDVDDGGGKATPVHSDDDEF